MPVTSFFSRFETIPKAELHLHLEGAIPLPYLEYLARRNHTNFQTLLDGFAYKNFPDFIRQWVAVIRQFRKPDDFSRLVEEVAVVQKAAGVIHTEAFFSPFDYTNGQFTASTVTKAILEGVQSVNKSNNHKMYVIADIVRNHGASSSVDRVQQLIPFLGNELIGIGLGGSEVGHPNIDFALAFDFARDAGFRLVAHAGETRDAESIKEVIHYLLAERVGHGIYAVHDADLIRELVKNKIPLEIAITSNLRTGAWPYETPHPVKRLFKAGVMVTINTDDPTFFQTTLKDEFKKLAEMGFSVSDMMKLIENGKKAAFIPIEEENPA